MLCTGIIKTNIHTIMHKKMLVAAADADVVADVVDVASDAADALAALAAGAGGSFNFVA